MQDTTDTVAPGLSPHVAPVLESLLDPLQSPYCHSTLIASLAECTSHLARARESVDPVLLDVAIALITFYAMPMEDAALHALLEKRLFNHPCRCIALFPYLRRSFHAFPDATVTVHTRISEGKGEAVVDLPSFIDVLSDFADRLLASPMGNHKIPGVRAWRRKISNLLDRNSPALIRSFNYWLQKTPKVYTFAFFGTLLELSPKMVEAMEKSGAVRRAFDERFHALVTAEYLSDAANHPAQPWSRLDLTFHGAGCMAFVIQMTMSTTSTFPQFRACFQAGAQERYDDICRLLSMSSKTRPDIQDGTMHDMHRMAHFGAHLYKLLDRESGPLSHIITDIWTKSPRHLMGGHYLTPISPSPIFAAILHVTLKVKRGDRMSACSNCKASRFCSKTCQKDSWKGGKTPHRDVCGTLAEIFKVHQKFNEESGKPEGLETLYSDAGISDEQVRKAVKYVIHMMECFSEYVD
ncbi:hypothetical protein B0H14DRAFT_2711476 [Mycena olivaceomarginata]|nr:hypothetical protein B0H14DRAFT_2711476 [Mycena olivaceomarginata]